MGVERFRRKPKADDREVQHAARYTPGEPLDDLLKVARMADTAAELAEVQFPGGRQVLLVAWTRWRDDGPPRVEYETVDAGDWLAYSPGSDFLYDSDDANWRQFYEPAKGKG
jgi:hypothetical protein